MGNIIIGFGDGPLSKVTNIIVKQVLKLCFQWWETCIAYPRSSQVFLWCCHGSLKQLSRWNDEGKHWTLPISITIFLYVVGILFKKIWKKTHEHKSSNCGANKQGIYEVACLICPLSLSCSVLRMCLLILIKFLSARGWYQADKSTTTKGGFALDDKSSITQY
jgi:hypothetical protein